jgi:CRP-like cAMP-binding protein
MSLRNVPERIMIALLDFARDGGTPIPNGALRVTAITHKTIAEYVGTSREMVTTEMNRLRRIGLVQYRRAYIDVFAAAVESALRRDGVTTWGS